MAHPKRSAVRFLTRPALWAVIGRFFMPVSLLVVLLAADALWPHLIAALGIEPEGEAAVDAGLAVSTLIWFASGVIIHRSVVWLFWEGWFPRRTGTEAPKLLIDMTGALIAVIVSGGALAFVFGISPTGFLTTSGIVIAIVGFALRSMISDLFTGVALGVERPFNIGDWIEVGEGEVGRVVEMNWRATRLVTKEEISVVIPNSQLATLPFRNYSKPDGFWRDKFDIVLDYEVTAYQAERLLLSAVNQIPEIAAIPREPEVRIIDYTERGIKWEIRYWVPDYPSMSALRYRVQRNVLRNLHFSAIRVPKAKMELSSNRRDVDDDHSLEDIRFFRETDLLSPLHETELNELAASARHRLVLQGDPVVRQGDESGSLYIVREGLLNVTITGDHGEETLVGHLVPGTFFGEMSLLTGAPAGATVTPGIDSVMFEIKKESLEPVIRKRPELAQLMSEVLASRQMLNARRLAERGGGDGAKEKATLKQQLLGRIRGFFGISDHPQDEKIPAE
tara:strand:+ start:199 stop:1716 length:1518 start_codon:yes stop_codon:yes gene_type:complete